MIKYSCEGIKPVKDYIFKEMIKFGYINKKENIIKLTKKINKNNLNPGYKDKNTKNKKIHYPPKKYRLIKKNATNSKNYTINNNNKGKK